MFWFLVFMGDKNIYVFYDINSFFGLCDKFIFSFFNFFLGFRVEFLFVVLVVRGSFIKFLGGVFDMGFDSI